MPIVPKKIPDMIQFYNLRVAQWTTNATALGLSSADTAALTTKTSSAVDALTAQQTAQNAAKDATTVLHDSAVALSLFGADLLKKIKAKAGQDGNSVYALASIPAPATPTPKPPPGQPFDFKVELGSTGALKLSWKCDTAGASGTIYQVWRQIGESGTNEYLGGSGKKEFTDQTLPAGSNNVLYQIQAVRSTAVGEFGTFTVKFGVGSGGEMTASIAPTGPKKVAA